MERSMIKQRRNPPRKAQKRFRCSCGASFYATVNADRKSFGCTRCKGLAQSQEKRVPSLRVIRKKVEREVTICPMCGAIAKFVKMGAYYKCVNTGACGYVAEL